MVILDTNVVSEMMRPAPDGRVSDWLRGVREGDAHLTAVTEAELRVGVALLPEGRRRAALGLQIDALLDEGFPGRILPFDSAAAGRIGGVVSDRRRIGRTIEPLDAQIAAIALSRGFALATRNVRDFEGCGLTLIDPWTGAVGETA